MIVSEITIKHQGKPPRRVILVRVDNRRRARVARRMRAMGFPLFAIRAVVRFSPAALNRVLAEAQDGFWGRHAKTIRREMARA